MAERRLSNQGLIQALMAQSRAGDGRGFWGNLGAGLREMGRQTPVGQLLTGGGFRGAFQALPVVRAFNGIRGMFGGNDPFSGAQASGNAGVEQMGPPSSLSMYGPATPYGGELDPNFVGPPSPESYAGNPSSPGFVGPPELARYIGAAGRTGMTHAGPTSRGAALDPVGSLLSRGGATNPVRLSGTERFNRGTHQV